MGEIALLAIYKWDTEQLQNEFAGDDTKMEFTLKEKRGQGCFVATSKGLSILRRGSVINSQRAKSAKDDVSFRRKINT